jgi:uncharacterized membrane protein (DUF4010 family)
MNLDWLADQGLERLPQFLTAIAIGLLIGLERERNPTAKAGLRTFALVALTGATAADLARIFESPSIIAVGLGVIALTMIAAYYHHHEKFHEWDPGTTTIAAVITCYLLAAMVMAGYVRLSVILAILTTVLLYFKAELRGVAHKLERRDLVSILQLAVVTFVVLPLLPDRAFGPYAVLNPRHIWLMVVLISSVSLAGYVALRVVGRERGATLLGFFGGLVSSTATTLAYSRYARTGVAFTSLSTAVILIANLVPLLRLMALATILAPAILSTLAPVLGTSFVTGSAAYVLSRRHGEWRGELTIPEISNPTELRTALGFAALYAMVLLLTAWLVDIIGSRGVYAMALISGLADVDAITLSNLRLYSLGTLLPTQVTISIVLALIANALFKLGIVRVVGGGTLFRRCLPVMTAMVAGAGLGVLLFT